MSTGPRRLGLEPLEDRRLLSGLFTVTSLSDSGTGSLRQAIVDANANLGLDTIDFNIGGGGPQTINLSSPLPTITDPVVIDGTTQPGIVVDGTGVTSTVLTISSGSSTVQAIAIRTGATPILLSGGSGNSLAGLDLSWTGEGTSGTGIHLFQSSNNTIEDVKASNRATGLSTTSSGGNTVQHNDFSGAGSWAIATSGYPAAEGNQYLYNDVSGSANGIALDYEANVTISAGETDMQGIPGTALNLNRVSNSHISGLDLSWTGEGKSGTGISLSSSVNSTIDEVMVMNRATGVYASSSSDVTMNCTSVLNNGTGISVTGSSSDITLNYNHIAGNSNGAANSAAALVDAEYNYWGAADGPTNLGGAGDSYSGNVDADPFLTRLPPCLNSAPVADAGTDRVLDQVGSGEGILVTLDGSGSYDPDGDPIVEYVWTGSFPEGGGMVYGVSPTVTLPVGTSTITLVVDDGYAVSAADTVDIIVNRTTWYVDDDAPGDPAPNDNTVSDLDEDGSPAHPFDRIQEGIDASADAHTVLVLAGTYNENLTWDTKDIDLIGAGAADTIVDSGGLSRCLTITDVPNTAILKGFTFTAGSADKGGGLYLSNSSLTVQESIISDNVAASGGGIYLSYSSAVITGNTITSNLATSTDGHYLGGEGGGGIYSWWSWPLIANNVISGNTTRSLGGGIMVRGLEISQTIVNNTIASNSAQRGGGGIYADHLSYPTIINNIVAFNSSGITGGYAAHPSLRYNNVYGNTIYDYGGLSAGEGDISEDPLFVDQSAGNFHLTRESPCIDVGDDNAVNPGWVDMDGELRIQGERVDIGADERVPNEPPVADAGGPYEVIVGGTVQLDASGTTDLDQPAETLLYEWDLDGDDVFGETGADAARGDETGITPTFSAVGLAGLSSVTVTLRVTDEGGALVGRYRRDRHHLRSGPKRQFVGDYVLTAESGGGTTGHDQRDCRQSRTGRRRRHRRQLL